jgi:hypothetical protein
MMHVSSTLKKSFAVSGLVLGLGGFGAFAGVAAAFPFPDPNPDTGSYDEQTDLQQDSCWGGIPSLPVSTAWKVGHPASAGCAHAR